MPEKRPIYLIEAPTQHILASAFVRIQEHYESPRFRGKVFDLETFMDWYAKVRGTFSYFEDWKGFNVPSHILRTFREGKFDPLSRKEKRILELLKLVPEPCYVIGVTRPLDLPTVKHEIVHGLFYTEPKYRQKVLRLLKSLGTEHFNVALEQAGYHKAVWEDEINAYSITCAGDLAEYGLNLSRVRSVRKALRGLFVEHFGFSLLRMGEAETLRFVHRIRM